MIKSIKRCAMIAALLTFGPLPAQALDLLEAYRMALGNDPTLLSAEAEASAAVSGTAQAAGGFFPSISYSSSRFNADTIQEVNTLTGPRTSNSSYLVKNDALTVRQPLFRYDRYAQYQQVKAQEAAAAMGAQAERQNLTLRLASAYLDALAALDNQEFVRAQLAAYSGQLTLAERALASGTGTRTDIDEARARVDITTASAIDAENQAANAARALAAIVGVEVTPGSLAKLSSIVALECLEDKSLENWMELVIQNNPELRYAEQQLAVAQHEVSKVRAQHFPTADLVYSKSVSTSDTSSTIGQTTNTGQIGVQVSIPLFSGGQIDAGVNQAIARVERARQQMESARRKLTINVGKSFDQVRHGRAKITAGQTAVTSATQAVRSTQKGLQAGTRNLVDILNAQQQEATARRDLARSRYEFLISQLSLQIQAGVPGDDVIGRLNPYFLHQP